MPISAAIAARTVRWADLDWEPVKDPRKARGKRHSHRGLLNLLVVGFASGCRTLREVEALAEDLDGRVKRKLGVGEPSDTTVDRVLRAQGASGLAEVLARQVKDGLRSKTVRNDLFPMGVVAIDGKKVWVGDEAAHPLCSKHTRDDGSPYWMLFAQRAVLVSSSARPCVVQRFIGAKTNETAQFEATFVELCEQFGKSFEVVTSDAGACSRHNAKVVHDKDKAYVFAIKDNQRSVFQVAKTRLGCKETPGDAARVAECNTDAERYRGSRITRSLFRTVLPDGETEVDFAGAKELWRVRQTTVHRGDRVVEDRYFIVNRRFSAQKALALVRLHWGIENGSNWTLDVVFGEDRGSPCTKNQALVVVSHLRLLAANLLAMFRNKLEPRRGEQVSWKRATATLQRALTWPFSPPTEPSATTLV